ncbi:DUF2059 domain-containing protein [Aquabacterium sp. OR-4]|uniref:DUF2059 domain-containing protein n=1 Tax=Aquabacterium sp. OR-4 TaxID=2978127 RepID=UPI0021B4A84B|nr:DUF2059 domain-containing protein [Aquabacterium sp. OR-4]MDT7833963.1 DUF2059 domain-containing protein [Aquabacterium sp. OR-4]
MRRLATLISLAACLATAQAAPPTDASIDALLAVTKTERMLDAMYANIEQMMRQGMQAAVQGQTLSDEQRRLLDTTPPRLAGVMRDELSYASIKPLYLQIYRESFTQEEVDGLLAFYRSPAGAALIEKMPVVMQKSVVAVQQRMGPLMEKLRQAMEAAVAEAKAAK